MSQGSSNSCHHGSPPSGDDQPSSGSGLSGDVTMVEEEDSGGSTTDEAEDAGADDAPLTPRSAFWKRITTYHSSPSDNSSHYEDEMSDSSQNQITSPQDLSSDSDPSPVRTSAPAANAAPVTPPGRAFSFNDNSSDYDDETSSDITIDQFISPLNSSAPQGPSAVPTLAPAPVITRGQGFSFGQNFNHNPTTTFSQAPNFHQPFTFGQTSGPSQASATNPFSSNFGNNLNFDNHPLPNYDQSNNEKIMDPNNVNMSEEDKSALAQRAGLVFQGHSTVNIDDPNFMRHATPGDLGFEVPLDFLGPSSQQVIDSSPQFQALAQMAGNNPFVPGTNANMAQNAATAAGPHAPQGVPGHQNNSYVPGVNQARHYANDSFGALNNFIENAGELDVGNRYYMLGVNMGIGLGIASVKNLLLTELEQHGTIFNRRVEFDMPTDTGTTMRERIEGVQWLDMKFASIAAEAYFKCTRGVDDPNVQAPGTPAPVPQASVPNTGFYWPPQGGAAPHMAATPQGKAPWDTNDDEDENQ